MAHFGKALRQLFESLQGVRRTHPYLSKARVGHKDYVWLPWQQQIGRFLSGFQRKSAVLSSVYKKLSIFLLFCLYTQNVTIK